MRPLLPSLRPQAVRLVRSALSPALPAPIARPYGAGDSGRRKGLRPCRGCRPMLPLFFGCRLANSLRSPPLIPPRSLRSLVHAYGLPHSLRSPSFLRSLRSLRPPSLPSPTSLRPLSGLRSLVGSGSSLGLVCRLRVGSLALAITSPIPHSLRSPSHGLPPTLDPLARSARSDVPTGSLLPSAPPWGLPPPSFWVGVVTAVPRHACVWSCLFRTAVRSYVYSLVSSALTGGGGLAPPCRLCARSASHSAWASRSS